MKLVIRFLNSSIYILSEVTEKRYLWIFKKKIYNDIYASTDFKDVLKYALDNYPDKNL